MLSLLPSPQGLIHDDTREPVLASSSIKSWLATRRLLGLGATVAKPHEHYGTKRQRGKRSMILPLLFTTAPLRCHSLTSRLAVNTVVFAALANCSLVMSR